MSEIKKKPYWPKFFYTKDDGGPNSGVKAYCLIEWKRFFSICLLKFKDGTREAFHSHAFNALSWVIKGKFVEERYYDYGYGYEGEVIKKKYLPSLFPKFTSRNNVHRVNSIGETWVFSIRGPWKDTWVEYRNDQKEKVTLTHMRNIVTS